MQRTSQIKGTSKTEQLLAVVFVLCAFAAGFLVVHKEEFMNGEIDQVIASYISSASDKASETVATATQE